MVPYFGLQVWDRNDLSICFENLYPFSLQGSERLTLFLQKSVCFGYKLVFLYNPYCFRFWGECTNCLDNCRTWNYQKEWQKKLEGESYNTV